MDLTSFTKKRFVEDIKEEILVDNNEVKITKIGGEVEFILKKKEALEKYQDYLFLSPTHAIKTKSKEESQLFFEKSAKEGVEGLMFKSLNAKYKPGIRTGAMAKLKETKEDLDLVIVGAEHGKGKRAGFYSSFIVAVKNDDFSDSDDKFLEIGKVSSGIKELDSEGASLENLTRLLKPLKISEEKDIVYFEPKIILPWFVTQFSKSTVAFSKEL